MIRNDLISKGSPMSINRKIPFWQCFEEKHFFLRTIILVFGFISKRSPRGFYRTKLRKYDDLEMVALSWSWDGGGDVRVK